MEREDLYARYDGPLPRIRSYETGPACGLLMLRDSLLAIRLKRGRREWEGLAALTFRVKILRQKLAAPSKPKKKYEQTEGHENHVTKQ